jgi:hypothetical protein
MFVFDSYLCHTCCLLMFVVVLWRFVSYSFARSFVRSLSWTTSRSFVICSLYLRIHNVQRNKHNTSHTTQTKRNNGTTPQWNKKEGTPNYTNKEDTNKQHSEHRKTTTRNERSNNMCVCLFVIGVSRLIVSASVWVLTLNCVLFCLCAICLSLQ